MHDTDLFALQGKADEYDSPRNISLPANATSKRRFLFPSGLQAGFRDVGIEPEHFSWTEPESYHSQPHGVRDTHRPSERHPQVTMHNGDILGVACPGMNVTIEPAAQLELSAGPFCSLDTARRVFDEFESDVARELEPVSGKSLAIGYDPACRAVDKELIPKARYEFMNEYLSAISPWGPRMMRASASTQVSIDYRDEKDCIKKMRVASVRPLFALVCDNAARLRRRSARTGSCALRSGNTATPIAAIRPRMFWTMISDSNPTQNTSSTHPPSFASTMQAKRTTTRARSGRSTRTRP